jgi:hypothetical protein
MRKMNFFWMLAIACMVLTVPFSCGKKDDNDSVKTPEEQHGETPGEADGETPGDAYSGPAWLLSGSDFYIISMDGVSADAVAGKTTMPAMMRDLQIWEYPNTYGPGVPTGLNSLGQAEDYIALSVIGNWNWAGGALLVTSDAGDQPKDLTAIDGDYYFHFAIKSPSGQTVPGFRIGLMSAGNRVDYYLGNEANKENATWIGNYDRDGEWHHFDIPVSHMIGKGWLMDAPLTGGVVSFENTPAPTGTEQNIEAVFFYKTSSPANPVALP